MVRRALLASAVLLVGCFPPPLDVTGKRCDPGHDCGPDFTCFDLLCQKNGEIDAGPDSLLVNSDFESLDAGQVMGWRAFGGDLVPTTGYQSSTGARLSSMTAQGTPTLAPQAALALPTLLGQFYCARGWVRGETDAGISVRLDISERFAADAGPPNNSASASMKVYELWVPFQQQRLVTLGDGKLDLRVEVTSKLKPGEAVVADDLQLKRSVDGTCRW